MMDTGAEVTAISPIASVTEVKEYYAFKFIYTMEAVRNAEVYEKQTGACMHAPTVEKLVFLQGNNCSEVLQRQINTHINFTRTSFVFQLLRVKSCKEGYFLEEAGETDWDHSFLPAFSGLIKVCTTQEAVMRCRKCI
jgi:hypothetical protein